MSQSPCELRLSWAIRIGGCSDQFESGSCRFRGPPLDRRMRRGGVHDACLFFADKRYDDRISAHGDGRLELFDTICREIGEATESLFAAEKLAVV